MNFMEQIEIHKHKNIKLIKHPLNSLKGILKTFIQKLSPSKAKGELNKSLYPSKKTIVKKLTLILIILIIYNFIFINLSNTKKYFFLSKNLVLCINIIIIILILINISNEDLYLFPNKQFIPFQENSYSKKGLIKRRDRWTAILATFSALSTNK